MAGSDRSSGNIRSAGMRCPATDDPDQSTRDLAECPARSPDLCGKDGSRKLPHFCTKISSHRFTAGTGRRGRGIGGFGLLPATNRLREAYKGAKRLRAYPSSSYIFGKPWKINALPVSLRPTGIGSKPERVHPRFGSGRWRPINAAVC
jgi:hypothetical protein